MERGSPRHDHGGPVIAPHARPLLQARTARIRSLAISIWAFIGIILIAAAAHDHIYISSIIAGRPPLLSLCAFCAACAACAVGVIEGGASLIGVLAIRGVRAGVTAGDMDMVDPNAGISDSCVLIRPAVRISGVAVGMP